MAELRKNDYISETMRLCKNLTQFKYDVEYDKCLKKMVAYNLEMLKIFPSRKTMREKQRLLDEFLMAALQMTHTKFGTADDFMAKESVQKSIVDLTNYEIDRKIERENKKWREQVARIVAACSTKRG